MAGRRLTDLRLDRVDLQPFKGTTRPFLRGTSAPDHRVADLEIKVRQMKENQWLTNITGIQEGIPYHGKLISGEELPGDPSPEDTATHSMNGIAIFKMKEGWLHFDFIGDENADYLAQLVIAKSAAPVISIPA